MIDYETIGVAIGVAGASVVTVLGTAIQNNARINALEKVMDARHDAMKDAMHQQAASIDKRFDRTDARIEAVRSELVTRIDKVQADVASDIDRARAELMQRIDRVQVDVSTFGQENRNLDRRVEKLEQ